jgi:hypothetical protein
MKQGVAIFTGLFLLLVYSCNIGDREEADTFVESAEYIQVVLFHLAQRCESCNAVERETKLVLEQEYDTELASGELRFVSLNFQSRNGKEAAGLLRASGQSLFVVLGDSVQDLTSPAFMFASTRPEYYREELRKALNKALE